MTKRRFYKMRQMLVTKVLQDAKARGEEVKGHWISRMGQPNFGGIIPEGCRLSGQVLRSYEQAWELLKPIREIYGL